MIPNVVAALNGKGGVLKTSLTSHTAGLAAAGGWRALIIDMDRQGNVWFDLGGPNDGGEALAAALADGQPLRPVANERPGLDIVYGGPKLDQAVERIRTQLATGDINRIAALERAIAPIAADYDLIVIDSPPNELLVRKLVLRCARFIVVPTKIDDASVFGIGDVLSSIAEARDAGNPELEILGVAITLVSAQASRLRLEAAGLVAELLGDPDLVFSAMIRNAEVVAKACRTQHILTNEYELQAAGATPYWELPEEQRKTAPRFSTAAGGVAADWQSLVEEILARYSALANGGSGVVRSA